MRIAAITAAILSLIVLASPGEAPSQEAKIVGCYYVPGFSLRLPQDLDKYQIKALRFGPKDEVLRPGDQYTVEFRVRSQMDTVNHCYEVIKTRWGIYAVLGNEPLRSGQEIGFYTSQKHPTSWSSDTRRDVTFTVPDPATLGADPSEGIVTMRMGVCPQDRRFTCAGHTFQVSNVGTQGYRISAPRPTTRALGQGKNRVSSGRPFSLEVDVKNVLAKTSDPVPRFVELIQIRGSGVPRKQKPFLRPARGQSNSFRFPMGVLAPGQYYFEACLTDSAGNPTEECGPSALINVGHHLTGQWEVGPVALTRLGGSPSSTSENREFHVSTTITNLTDRDNPFQGRRVVILRRAEGSPTTSARQGGERGTVAAGQTATKKFRMPGLASGVYEFKACVAESDQAALPDMVCGPWSSIEVGTQARPIPPEGEEPESASACTGGRVKDANGRCVCPAGSFWNPNPGFNRCDTCENGREWSASDRRCVCPQGWRWNAAVKRCTSTPLACTDGKVRNASGVCACPEGLVVIRGKCAPIKGVPAPQVVAPEPSPIRCAGGKVSNGACICPRGYTRKTIKTGVFVCKAPANAPAPQAAEEPATPELQCIGGEVRGVLCWCGIGRFPRAVGNNAYKCE